MFTKEMMKALEADGEKLKQLTGEDHGPVFLYEVEYIACERCHGVGEVEVRPIVGPYEDPTPCAEICSACEGTGRFCVEVERAAPRPTEPEIIF